MRFRKLIGSLLRKPIKRLLALPADKKDEMLRVAFPAVTSWHVEGDYFEFGVYEGRAMIHAYKAASRCKRPTKFFAFDSFEGLPYSNETGNKFQKSQYSCTEERFCNNLRQAGVDLSLVKSTKGFFDQSLTTELQNELAAHKAAIVWIDCDLYDSTVPVLNFILPFLQNGTILCFDDWFSFGADPNKGEIRATHEWLARNSHVRLTHYRDFGLSGRSFIVTLNVSQHSKII
ncbi:MAG: TylF/MycF/NovP-related O-methyltransferase [Pseudomonadota bacterium]|nr:TylF/MycF/NovP-related O-methyltransferase [Pseudomonadota bacterium]